MSPGELGQASSGDGISSAEIRYDPWTHNKKKHTQTHKQTYTHCLVPPHPQSTMAKPCVSVGINRSAQSSSHPALKSFPEVVLQKPAAEEDKRAAIPQAQRLLSFTQLSLCCPLLLLYSSLSPTFLPSLIISIPPSFPQHLTLSVLVSVPTFPLDLHIILLSMPPYTAPPPFCVPYSNPYWHLRICLIISCHSYVNKYTWIRVWWLYGFCFCPTR